ncbi:hypothetical protein GGR53DRAFT_510568 [Hypoxylon sp. FL1150]|nr:hypothetical protein GGR53DRAFT_510568 [Hypoxylon sp. FL1150]
MEALPTTKKLMESDPTSEKKPLYTTLTYRELVEVTEKYRATLDQISVGVVDPKKWYYQWHVAHLGADIYQIPDVTSALAVRDFLHAVGATMFPCWAAYELGEYAGNLAIGRSTTLERVSVSFIGMVERVSKYPETSMRRGTVRDWPNNSKKSADSQPKISGHNCPCKKTTSGTHPWTPEECGILQAAVTGHSDRKISNLGEGQLKNTKKRYQAPRWRYLRAYIELNGWSVEPLVHSRGNNNDSNDNSDLGGWSGNIVSMVMYPPLVYKEMEKHDRTEESEEGDFTTGTTTTVPHAHPLSESTVFSTDSSVHIVNDRKFFEPGTFRPAASNNREYVDIGTERLPVAGTGKRRLRKIMNGRAGPNIRDIILHDVVLIDGFHTNTVSAARARKADVWFMGHDSSLRHGSLEENRVVKKLVNKHDLIFLDYKPIR